jgi:hypothetical protein
MMQVEQSLDQCQSVEPMDTDEYSYDLLNEKWLSHPDIEPSVPFQLATSAGGH